MTCPGLGRGPECALEPEAAEPEAVEPEAAPLAAAGTVLWAKMRGYPYWPSMAWPKTVLTLLRWGWGE